ncbi:hypothetical protein F4818DRAFT_419441 [Hypoxylon cercidicola]|nr:hypothetical protein F4818DRAFT_419441 [Hypoxylon cercidicola]
MCILPDDESDWDRESSRMASVYQGAFITIAATCSRNSSERLIRSSSPAYASSLASKYRTADRQIPPVNAFHSTPAFIQSVHRTYQPVG